MTTSLDDNFKLRLVLNENIVIDDQSLTSGLYDIPFANIARNNYPIGIERVSDSTNSRMKVTHTLLGYYVDTWDIEPTNLKLSVVFDAISEKHPVIGKIAFGIFDLQGNSKQQSFICSYKEMIDLMLRISSNRLFKKVSKLILFDYMSSDKTTLYEVVFVRVGKDIATPEANIYYHNLEFLILNTLTAAIPGGL